MLRQRTPPKIRESKQHHVPRTDWPTTCFDKQSTQVVRQILSSTIVTYNTYWNQLFSNTWPTRPYCWRLAYKFTVARAPCSRLQQHTFSFYVLLLTCPIRVIWGDFANSVQYRLVCKRHAAVFLRVLNHTHYPRHRGDYPKVARIHLFNLQAKVIVHKIWVWYQNSLKKYRNN